MEKKNKNASKTAKTLSPVLSIAGALIVAFFPVSGSLVASAETGVNPSVTNPYGYDPQDGLYTPFSGAMAMFRHGNSAKYDCFTSPLWFSFGEGFPSVLWQTNYDRVFADELRSVSYGYNSQNDLYLSISGDTSYNMDYNTESPIFRVYDYGIRAMSYENYVDLLSAVGSIAYQVTMGGVQYNRATNVSWSWKQDFYNTTSDEWETVELGSGVTASPYAEYPLIYTNFQDLVRPYAYNLLDPSNTLDSQKMLVLGTTDFRIYNAESADLVGGYTRVIYMTLSRGNYADKVWTSDVLYSQDLFDLDPNVVWNGDTGLLDFVNSFLTTEWFDGFSFSTLLTIMFGALLIGLILKIFVGG